MNEEELKKILSRARKFLLTTTRKSILLNKDYTIGDTIAENDKSSIYYAYKGLETFCIKVMNHDHYLIEKENSDMICPTKCITLIRYIDFFDLNENSHAIVMPVYHRTVSHIISAYNNQVPSNAVVKIFFSLINSLEYLENKKICHSDIKPDNLFLHSDNNGPYVILGDYGAAIRYGEDIIESTSAYSLDLCQGKTNRY